MSALQPKKQKYRLQQKGRSLKRMKETRGTWLAFGDYGLQALTPAWITGAQLEAARRAMTHFLKREGRVWIRIFPDKPVTKFPAEVKMGKGKGGLSHYVVPIRPGRILFEVAGVAEGQARESLRLNFARGVHRRASLERCHGVRSL